MTNFLTVLRTSALVLCVTSFAVGAAGCDKKASTSGEAKSEGKAEDKAADKPAPKPEKPPEMTEKLDVGAAVKDKDDTRYAGITMTGPKGASVEDSGMGLTVKWGEVQFEFRFQFEDETPVADAKKAATSDEADKLVKMHTDTADAVLMERRSALASDGDPNNHHFVAKVKVGDKYLVCKNEGYGQFSKVQAQALLATCQSAKKAAK